MLPAEQGTGCRLVLWRTDPPASIDTIRTAGWTLDLSPDGSRLITARNWTSSGSSVPIKLWDVATRRHLISLGRDGEVGNFFRMSSVPDGNGVFADVGFLPDGNGIFAVTEEGLHVWSVPTLAEIETTTKRSWNH